MSATAKLDRNQAAEFLDGLRRDISAARLRVTLDEKLGRDTPAAVKKLAALPEPPSIEGETDPAAVSVAPAAAVVVDQMASEADLAGILAGLQESGSNIVVPVLLNRQFSGWLTQAAVKHGAHEAPKR